VSTKKLHYSKTHNARCQVSHCHKIPSPRQNVESKCGFYARPWPYPCTTVQYERPSLLKFLGSESFAGPCPTFMTLAFGIYMIEPPALWRIILNQISWILPLIRDKSSHSPPVSPSIKRLFVKSQTDTTCHAVRK
jgi:hypothetical protein